jgi:hypothetical protein
MMSSLEIDGKMMLSIRSVSTQTGYSRDYITRLAREQKIIAVQVGRQWFVELGSLEKYSTMMALEQKLRQQRLSEERKKQLQVVELTEKKIENQVIKRKVALHRPMAVVVGVLLLGLVSGFAMVRIPFFSKRFTQQTASISFVQWFYPEAVVVGGSPSGSVQPTPAGAEVINFSHEAFRLSTMAQPTDGVLLLPSATSGTSSVVDVKKLFSDDVKIFKDENGQQYVAQVNSQGEMVRRIPFLIVPVNTPNTP